MNEEIENFFKLIPLLKETITCIKNEEGEPFQHIHVSNYTNFFLSTDNQIKNVEDKSKILSIDSFLELALGKCDSLHQSEIHCIDQEFELLKTLFCEKLDKIKTDCLRKYYQQKLFIYHFFQDFSNGIINSESKLIESINLLVKKIFQKEPTDIVNKVKNIFSILSNKFDKKFQKLHNEIQDIQSEEFFTEFSTPVHIKELDMKKSLCIASRGLAHMTNSNKKFMCINEQGDIKVFELNVETKNLITLIKEFKIQNEETQIWNSILPSPSGNHILVAFNINRNLYLYNKKLELVMTWNKITQTSYLDVCCWFNDSLFITGHNLGGTLNIFSIQEKLPIATFNYYPDAIVSLALNKNFQDEFFVGDIVGKVYCIQYPSTKLQWEKKFHSSYVNCIREYPNTTDLMISASSDHFVIVWSASKQEVKSKICVNSEAYNIWISSSGLNILVLKSAGIDLLKRNCEHTLEQSKGKQIVGGDFMTMVVQETFSGVNILYGLKNGNVYFAYCK